MMLYDKKKSRTKIKYIATLERDQEMNVLKLWNEVWFGYMSVGDGSEAESDVTGLPDGTKLTTPMQGFP
jgi:hypothetical protein